jgi:hypothetical protein
MDGFIFPGLVSVAGLRCYFLDDQIDVCSS